MISVYITLKSNKDLDDFDDSIKKTDEKRKEEDKKSEEIKVIGMFDKISDCRKALAENKPHVLFLGVEFNNWEKFCKEIRKRDDLKKLKILAVATYEEYIENMASIYELTNGHISREFWEQVIDTAIETVLKGAFFSYDFLDAKAKKQDPPPEWLHALNNTIITESIRNTNHKGYYVEMVKNLTHIIETVEETRNAVIKILLTEKEDQFDKNSNDKYDFETLLIDNLILNGFPNWRIAHKLNKGKKPDPNYLNKVRIKRMDLILRISGKNTMVYRKAKKIEGDALKYEELNLLRYIAAGYSNVEIAFYLCLSIDTIKSNRKKLLEKFLETGTDDENNSISMVVKALNMGLIKSGEIVELMTPKSRKKWRDSDEYKTREAQKEKNKEKQREKRLKQHREKKSKKHEDKRV